MEAQTEHLRIAGTISDSIVDGIGIRFVIFCQGCAHHCPNCFNPDTHAFDGGRLVETRSLLAQIARNPLLSGVTFSGGDPMEQAEACARMAKQIKAMGLTVWVYTGYTFEYILAHREEHPGWAAFLPWIDVLVDGRYEEACRNLTLAFRGSENQRLIDVPRSLSAGGTAVCYPDPD